MPLQLECGVESPRASGLFAFEGFDVSVLKEMFLQKTFLHKTVIAICKTKKTKMALKWKTHFILSNIGVLMHHAGIWVSGNKIKP
jgi:hypothetical protein